MNQNLKLLATLAFTSVILTGCDSNRMSRQQPTLTPGDTTTESGIDNTNRQPADGALINRDTGSSTMTTDGASTTTTMRRDTGGSGVTDPDRTGSPLRRSNGNGASIDDKSTTDGTTSDTSTDTETGTSGR